MEQVTLSNGVKVDIKPLSIMQAKACGLSKIIKKIAKSVDEDGNVIVNEFDFSEDEIINVVKQVYKGDLNDLSFMDAMELFSQIIAVCFKKK
jgi:predicted RNase H-like nuclease